MQGSVQSRLLQFCSSKKYLVKMFSVTELVGSQLSFLKWEYKCDHYHNEKWAAEKIQHEGPGGTFNYVPKVESYTTVIIAMLFGKWHNNFIILYLLIMEDSLSDSFAVPDLYLIVLVLLVTNGNSFYDWHHVV
jgi:hypothetical protein